MSVGKKIETRGHIIGFKEEIAKAAAENDDAFFTWFNAAKDTSSAFAAGAETFEEFILSPCKDHLKQLKKGVALEIGHGGGRILAAAARYFDSVIGIDIHDSNDKVESQLNSLGLTNFLLIKSDGLAIPQQSSSIDFLYSFIVLQHIEKINIFNNYWKEAFRVLKPGGVAVLYFGRKQFVSRNKKNALAYYADLFLERLFLSKGYQELPTRINCVNLLITLPYAKTLAEKEGFEVLEQLVSHRKKHDGVDLYGGQHGLIVKKNRSPVEASLKSKHRQS